MVSDVTIGSALNSQANTQASTAQLAEDFSQFLTLLTTQLQNQDPLSPMDTTEFTNQLVAFTGVEQQINTNQKLDDLVALQLGNVMGSALGYVGLDASYVSSEFFSDGENPVTINYALDGQAVDVSLIIENEAGEQVFQTSGATSAGNQEFIWDGLDNFGNPVEPGTYRIRIDALDIDDNAVGSSTVVEGRVRGVETQNGVVFLLIGERAVTLGNVLNVSEPEEPTSTDTPETPPEEDA